MAVAHAAAWALKQACYDAWHRDPARAREAAAELRSLASAEPGDATLQALAAWTAGIAALTQGRLGDTLAQLAQAQRGFESVGDAQHAAETRVPQIVALSMLGRDDDARACAEAALAQFVASGDERSAGKVELNLGNLLFRQDRHLDAEPRFRHAALRLARSGDVELSVMADGMLANVLGWQFRFDEALQMFERARLRAQAHGLPMLVSQMHQGIGQIELHRGRWHVALHHLATAAALAAGASPQRRIEAEAALADAYLAVNLLAEAVAVYDRLIAEAVALPAPTEQAWATLQRARALARLGDTAGALDGFAQASGLYTQAGNDAVCALAAIGRGRIELAAGDAVAALASAASAEQALAGSGIVGWQLEALLLRAAALAARGEADAARAGYAAVLAQARALPQIAAACHAGLGELALATGDRGAARDAFERALSTLEELRAALPDDELRSALAGEVDVVQPTLVRIAAAAGDAAQLMLDMERGRARALALALGGRAGASRDEQAPRSDATTRLHWLRQQWQQAASEGDAERAPALAARVRAIEAELLEVARRERLGVAVAGASDRPFDAAMLAQLAPALGDDRALVAYQWLGDTLLACVVTTAGVQHAAWPLPDLPERIRSVRFQIDTMRLGRALAQRHASTLLARARAHLHDLHARVWAPLLPLLDGCRRVVVLPHRELHYLPFAALHDGEQWLVQRHEITLAPSAAVWLALQRRAPPRFDRALIVGVGGDALPQVAREAGAVAAAFGAGARTLRDADATLAALSALAGDADVLHLACHGVFRADSPAFSYLQLGDGRLALHDAARLRLRAALVTLSACETGASRLAPGDEVLGLVRAFLLAGAGAVLATLWAVDDEATATLAARFYERLAAGDAPARALQRVQADAAAAGAHPFDWAAFALHGRG